MWRIEYSALAVLRADSTKLEMVLQLLARRFSDVLLYFKDSNEVPGPRRPGHFPPAHSEQAIP